MGDMLPPMRELYPNPAADVDPVERYGADDRTASTGERPWVLVNMIATVDGATAVDGRSGGLGGPADKVVFGAIRAVADVILVGAGTVRAEAYGSPRTPPTRDAPPRLAIVTRSLDIDPASRVFTDAPTDRRPIVVTTDRSDAARRDELARVADVMIAGDDDVDVELALTELRAQGSRVVLCEGGPSLNGHLVAAGVLDELCVSLAPLVAGGSSPRLAHGLVPPDVTAMRLDRALEADSMLFLRYVRDGAVSVVSERSPS
jgi:riboflavin biosynthesis pyrimidine reductase